MFVLFVFLLPLTSFAEAAEFKAEAISLNKVYIPQSNLQTFMESFKRENLRALPLHLFNKMLDKDITWKNAIAKAKTDKQKRPDYRWAILNSSFTGKQTKKEIVFNGQFTIETTGKGMYIIPVLNGDLSLVKAEVNDEQALLLSKHKENKQNSSPFSIIIESKKLESTTHEIKIEFVVPVKQIQYYQKASFSVLPSPCGSLEVTINGTNLDVSIPSSLGLTQKTKNNTTKISTSLKSMSKIDITWFRLSQKTVQRKPEKQKQTSSKKEPLRKFEKQVWLESKVFQAIEIGEGRVGATVQVNINVFRKPLSTFTIKTSSKVSFAHLQLITNNDLVESSIADKENGTIKVNLKHPLQGQLSLFFSYYNDTNGKSSFETSIPDFSVVNSNQESGYIAIRRKTNVEISVKKKSNSLTEIPLSSLPPYYLTNNVKKSLLTYHYLTPPFILELKIKRYSDAPILTTIVDKLNASTTIAENGVCFTNLEFVIRSRTKTPIQFDFKTMGENTSIEEVLLNNSKATISDKGAQLLEVSLNTVKSTNQDKPMTLRLSCVHKTKPPGFAGSQSLSLPLICEEIKKINWSVALPEKYRCFAFFGNYGKRSWNNPPLPISSSNYNLSRKYRQYGIERALLPANEILTVNYSFINKSITKIPALLFLILGMVVAHSLLQILVSNNSKRPYLSLILVVIIIFALFSNQVRPFTGFFIEGIGIWCLCLTVYLSWKTGCKLRNWWKNRKKIQKMKKDRKSENKAKSLNEQNKQSIENKNENIQNSDNQNSDDQNSDDQNQEAGKDKKQTKKEINKKTTNRNNKDIDKNEDKNIDKKKNKNKKKEKEKLTAIETNIARVHNEIEGGDDNE